MRKALCGYTLMWKAFCGYTLMRKVLWLPLNMENIVWLHLNVESMFLPRFKDPYQSKTVTEGMGVSVTCSAVGTPYHHKVDEEQGHLGCKKRIQASSWVDMKLSYSIKETAAKLQTQSELQIASSSRNDTGIYTCSATSEIGADEAVIKLIVQDFTQNVDQNWKFYPYEDPAFFTI
ncbi:down syndrome cell adhesion molecule [Caerostris extrusa]|uniref:Down syndrome cell adhesion molecule n=1 Tax=Caerostris extrusa TaxID=172846 RepID=A0AAV4WVZ5_CAEEX|nr:down syndrome cell adhesion molecule [Caerostris extrusa]